MRGKANFRRRLRMCRGITPAYAGKSSKTFSTPPLSGDHPRLCGEKDRVKHCGTMLMGSPPPMRGKEYRQQTEELAAGITPAYAGKREVGRLDSVLTRDHPRLCGEKRIFASRFFMFIGSPPPMRGKVIVAFPIFAKYRITPAYAGKRIPLMSMYRPVWDHPRLCGEKTKKIPKQRYFFHQLASFSFSLQYT